jgi:hypothetical protein
VEVIMMLSLLKGLGLGAGLMYFFDPEMGPRRRSLLGDRITELGHELEEALTATTRDVKVRAQGVVSEAGRAMDVPLDVDTLRPSNWPPEVRLAAGTVGALVGLNLIRKMPLTSLALGAVGLSLAVQDLSRNRSDAGISWPTHDWGTGTGRSSSSAFEREDFPHYGSGSTGERSVVTGGHPVAFDPAAPITPPRPTTTEAPTQRGTLP